MRYNKVKVESCSLEQLFKVQHSPIGDSEIIGKLTIPEYQRPYVWQEKEINTLLRDLGEFLEIREVEKPDYYLGSIIVHQDNEQLKIIDGQQRITTVVLLCKFLFPDFKTNIQFNSSQSIKNIHYCLSYLKAIFCNELSEFIKLAEILKSLDLSKINITLVVTSTEDLAYTFFETQNTGGVRLNGTDILKAHHLRGIKDDPIMVKYQARKWEKNDSIVVENVVELLTKIRFWNLINWRDYPQFKDKRAIKRSIIDEYTVLSKRDNQDIAYYYTSTKREGNKLYQTQQNHYRQIRQPLSDGRNTLDFITEYVDLYNVLFNSKHVDHRVDIRFYDFFNEASYGIDGTLFLKELYQITLVTYVSKFGFYKLFETSLWLFRMVYSMRVSYSRNVKEMSIPKFVKEKNFIDNILSCYEAEDLIKYLEKFKYELSTDNMDLGNVKYKYLKAIDKYFMSFKDPSYYKEDPSMFDRDLLVAINNKLREEK